MIRSMSHALTPRLAVLSGSRLARRLPALTAFAYAAGTGPVPLARHPAWLDVFRAGLGHETYAVEVEAASQLVGFLPLSFVESTLFGRFLVSLPYLNSNGVVAASPEVARILVGRAAELADELDARHLELRHETPVDHPALNGQLTSKVHLRKPLPATADELWKGFDTKVRNQVRKGEKGDFALKWGTHDRLDDFYAVLCRNMRDLGTPVYGRGFFDAILSTFPITRAGGAEIAVAYDGPKPVAAALLLHGRGVTEVPTASSLRDYNASSVNMLMYRHLLDRAVERGQSVFDFGRSTTDGATFKFKRQWGAVAHPATWQYHLRDGDAGEMRPDNPKYQRLIRLWQRLPVPVTRAIGPTIVRGIP
jgi:serine/alanine adding enzyme